MYRIKRELPQPRGLSLLQSEKGFVYIFESVIIDYRSGQGGVRI